MIWVFSLKGNRAATPSSQFAAPDPPPTEVSFGFSGLLGGAVPVVKTDAVKIGGLRLQPRAHHGRDRHQGDVHQLRRSAAQCRGRRRGRLGHRAPRKGEAGSVTFNRPGTYTYHLHAASLHDRPDHRDRTRDCVRACRGRGSGGRKADGPMAMPGHEAR